MERAAKHAAAQAYWRKTFETEIGCGDRGRRGEDRLQANQSATSGGSKEKGGSKKQKNFFFVKRAERRRLSSIQKQNKGKKRFKMLTWNTRGWGARYSEIDQAIKSRCIVHLVERRGVGLAILSDLKFPEVGVRTYRTALQCWTLVAVGSVGFLMNEEWADWWTQGGGVFAAATPEGRDKVRAASVTFPRVGWRRGLHVVGVYAPTAAARRRQRDEFMRQVGDMLGRAPGSSMQVLAGDFNAELGLARHGDWGDVLGPFGNARRSDAGKEWLEWCRNEGWVEAASQYAQRCRGTWWHCRFNTEHVLDHFFLPRAERWHLTACSVVHAGRGMRAGGGDNSWQWGPYTDHHPVEMTMRVGKLWVPRRRAGAREERADVAKLNGMGEATRTYRRRFQEVAGQKLTELTEGAEHVAWQDITQACHQAAVEVVGTVGRKSDRPWLEGHWEELQRMDAAITEGRRADREARARPRPWSAQETDQARQTRSDLNQVRRTRRRQLGVWETTYWATLAARALQADKDGDTAELFKMHKALGAYKQVRRRDGAEARPADIEAEREAWREHFCAIQAGVGEVPDRVWDNIPQSARMADWLALGPSHGEFERAVGQMQCGRAAGEDGFIAEYLKYGGPGVQEVVFQVVKRTWEAAQASDEGLEAENWPSEWRVGLVVPLWKRKGDKRDKNTWRGVTLLSVGTKVMARILANRLARWCDPWLHEGQRGFRTGRGTDDAQQVSRRIAEEVARTNCDEVVLIRFFDIQKAYPRVCRPAMWKVLQRRGCPEAMVKVLRALHNHTEMKVRVHGGCSNGYVPERGLREGCPSSPVLFNIYHDAVMEDFRTRRGISALEQGQVPGLEWEYKVDGRLTKRHIVRAQAGTETATVVLGDFGYADDTGIVGTAEEVPRAERLFGEVLRDWEETLHPDKTEGLRISGAGRQATDVRCLGEGSEVKHVGGWVAENGRPWEETKRRRAVVAQKIAVTAKSWNFGGSSERRRQCNVPRSVRLTVMRAVVIPTAMATARTRAWDSLMLQRIEQMVMSSLRRCFGVKYQTLHNYHISNDMLRRAAGWPKVKHMVMRASLTWLGHVARMHVNRKPKQMLFGWWKGKSIKYNTWTAQSRWLERCLKDAGVPRGDWFRLAQNRRLWRHRIRQAFHRRN